MLRIALPIALLSVATLAALWLALGSEGSRGDEHRSSEGRGTERDSSLASHEPVLRPTKPEPFETQPFEPGPEIGPWSPPPAGSDRSLVIQVVDVTDTPRTGVPVVLWRTSEGRIDRLWEGITEGADGIVAVEDVSRLLRSLEEKDSLSAGFGFPELPRTFQPLDPANLPAERVRLVLPPTGRLTVEFIDSGNRVLQEVGLVSLRARDPANGRDVGVGVRALVRTPGGRAEFPFITLGLRLVVRGEIRGRGFARAEVVGPETIGQEVRAELRFEDPFPAVIGRAVNADREPLSSTRLRSELLTNAPGGPRAAMRRVMTDDEGRFRIAITLAWGAGHTRRLSLSLRAGTAKVGSAEIDLSRELAPGDNDVGDVVFNPPRPVVSGVVIDDSGNPVADAKVRLSARRSEEKPPSSVNRRSEATTTDGEGRFTLSGNGPMVDLSITASKQGYVPSRRQEVSRGTSGITITLHRPAVVAGSLLLDPAVPRWQVRLALLRENGAPLAVPRFRDMKERLASNDGTFEWRSVGPGVYALEIRIVGEPDPCLVVRDIVTRAGEATDDPRLRGIDLRGMLAIAELRVLLPDGDIARRGRLVIVPPKEHRGLIEGFSLRGRPVKVVTSGTAIDVMVLVPGFRSIRLAGIIGDHDVTMEPPLRVRLRLAPDVAAPEGGSQLRFRLQLRDDGDSPSRPWRSVFYERDNLGYPVDSSSGEGTLSSTSLDAVARLRRGSRDASLPVATPGRYALVVEVGKKGNWIGVDDPTPARITVRDTATEQVFAISYSPDSLDRALRILPR